MTSSEPGRIVVAGDWHGGTNWAQQVIRQAGRMLADEPWRLIIQLGDFGIWPASHYLDRVSAALDRAGVVLWFIDGNHEDFPHLDYLRGDVTGPAAVDARGRMWHLPRGHRWTWHGREWLAMGGGVSVDRSLRTERHDWWPQEEITAEQAAQAIVAGGADVMVTHDCPAGVVHSYGPPPACWLPADLARSEAHQQQLQLVVNACQPSHLMHGHLHRAYQRETDFGYGPVQVTGLNRDGQKWNYAVLDTRTMEWEAPG